MNDLFQGAQMQEEHVEPRRERREHRRARESFGKLLLGDVLCAVTRQHVTDLMSQHSGGSSPRAPTSRA